MNLIETHARLLKMGASAFRTADAAAYLNSSNSAASQMLSRLSAAGHLLRLRQGVWTFPGKLDPLALASQLTAPFPSYVSLQSALYYHGFISQIPSVTYAVSVGRTRLFRTPLGTVSIHHLQPEFFFGFEIMDPSGAAMATPEKALVDFLYFKPARSHLFCALPELELPPKFNVQSARRMIQRVPSIRRRTLVTQSFEELMSNVL